MITKEGFLKLTRDQREKVVAELFAAKFKGFRIAATSLDITIPAGYCSQGLPVGLQMAARCGEDEKLLDLAYAFEQATAIRRPPRLACF